METWRGLFEPHGIEVAQVLASKSDFQSRGHYLNMRGCIEGLLGAGLLPIANENDVVSVTELMFTDNDELAGLLAAMLDADRLCLLSTVDGVLDADGSTIERWDDERHRIADLVQAGTSQLGRGGMHNKITVARRAAGLGVETTIADGRRAGILRELAEGRHAGTRFPARPAASPARRWLASMADHTLGSVTVNPGAEAALLDRQRLTSLLPVGVERVAGDFHRGDVIEVRAGDGRLLGCGRAQYDREEAERTIGQRDQRPIIHYDYLYLID
jgi:glutamate 5-kinase